MKTIKPLPPLDVLEELFQYCPGTGDLLNKKRRGGKVTAKTQRYRTCFVEGGHYTQHRVAWKLMTGEDPPSELDHINRDSFDNRWINLQAVDRSGNCVNTETRKDNSLGERCIHLHKPTGKYVVQVQRNGERCCVYLKTLEEAIELRDLIIQESK